MKIAIFTGTIVLKKYDARAIYVIETLKYLSKFDDLDILLISPNNVPDEIKNDLKHISYTLYDKTHFRYVSAAFSSIPKLLTNDFDLLHCIEVEAASIALIANKIKRRKARIIFQVLGLASSESEVHSNFSLKAKIIKPFSIWRGNVIIERSYGFITLSEAVKDYLQTQYDILNSKIFVAPIGIDLELVGKASNEDLTLRNKLALDDKKVIMYAGWISALHGVLDLVKAMEIINDKIENVILVILGYGPLEALIKGYVKNKQIDNIIFTGKVPHNEIFKYYSIADVLVIPHVRCMQTELNPTTKVYEYLASGKPIVASNLKPIADVVGGNAVLVEPENPQAFAEGILKVLRNKDLANKMGENGKKIIFRYSWEESAKRIHEAYDFFFKDN